MVVVLASPNSWAVAVHDISLHARDVPQTVGVVMVALCAMAGTVLVSITFQKSRSTALLQAWRTPALAYRLSDPWELKPWERESYGMASQYGFELEPTDEPGPMGGAWPLYSPEACVPQPFADMPPGYICTSTGYGIYVVSCAQLRSAVDLLPVFAGISTHHRAEHTLILGVVS